MSKKIDTLIELVKKVDEKQDLFDKKLDALKKIDYRPPYSRETTTQQ